MVSSFFDLKNMIIKSCIAKSDAKDYAEKHNFSINMVTLDNMFAQKGLDYHVMAGLSMLDSYIPCVTDIHTVSDYVEDQTMLMNVMDGYTQVVIFTIYSTKNKDGEIAIGEDEEHPYDHKKIFALCNGKKIDLDLMGIIVKQLPIYKIMVARRFNPSTDLFVYEVFFRSNRAMSEFYRSEMAAKEAAKKE